MTQSAQKIRGFTVLGTLGQNHEGGRITRLAASTDGEKVVIKEFRFVTDSKWDDYSAIAREIDILKNLDHPRIPKFIDSFETEQGACLVQEYIDAPNLDQKRTRTTEQVQKIAQDLLEILVYLQSLTPPVLHRDIKPGNLLLDADRNLYLVDFGFSRIGLQDVAVSSMVRGTTGFMPPEQMLGLDLTKASDLYSVGATIICLILGIPSGRMAQLMDIGENRLKFSDRLPRDIDPHFVRWLQRMTAPRAGDRFADAAMALAALESSPKLTSTSDEIKVLYDYNSAWIEINKIQEGVIVARLYGKCGYQNEKLGFYCDGQFYSDLKSGEDTFSSCVPFSRVDFKEVKNKYLPVNIENAAKNLLVSKAAEKESFDRPKSGLILKTWHLVSEVFDLIKLIVINS
jgi:serine/threonine protein kinase